MTCVAPQQRQRVVAAHAFRRRRVGLEAVGPAPQQLEAAAVPDDGVEGREQPHGVVGRVAARRGLLAGGPEPGDAVHHRLRQPRLRSRQRGGALVGPLRRARRAGATPVRSKLRSGSGAYLRSDHVDQRVQRRGGVGGRVRASRAAYRRTPPSRRGHAQQAAVVHAVEQLRAGVAVAAEPVARRAVVRTARRPRAGAPRRVRARSPAPRGPAPSVPSATRCAPCAGASAAAWRAAGSRS